MSGIYTTSELRRRVGTDFSSGLREVTAQTGCEEQEIVAVLVAELLHESVIGWSAVRDMIVAIAALGGTGLIISGIDTPPPKQYLVARTSLPALHTVTEDDLLFAPTETTGIDAVAEVVGRRLLLPVARAEALSHSHLTPKEVAPEDLDGLTLLELAIEDEATEVAASIGSRVRLLFSPKVLAGQGGLEIEALVLAFDSSTGENSTTVAVDSDKISAIVRFLATSEVSIARQCCPAVKDGAAKGQDS